MVLLWVIAMDESDRQTLIAELAATRAMVAELLEAWRKWEPMLRQMTDGPAARFAAARMARKAGK